MREEWKGLDCKRLRGGGGCAVVKWRVCRFGGSLCRSVWEGEGRGEGAAPVGWVNRDERGVKEGVQVDAS